jgi:multidrug efflux pump subunit AcrA (membrane-fusion protein)
LKTRGKTVLIIAIVVVVAGGGAFLFRGKLFPKTAAAAASATSTAATVVKVTRSDLTSSITASGQLQPNTITTIRPDSNMPTRKLVKILVKEGEHVTAGQALAAVDPSGLELDLQSAKANYAAQSARLANLKAKPAGLDLAAASASLASAQSNLDAAQQSYDQTKALFDKNLAAKNELTTAERALSNAKLSYTSAELSYENTKAQNTDADIAAQQSTVASAQSAYEKAQLVYDSSVIRSPAAGIVADIPVNVGDLISPSTALMTVVDPNPMWLVAQVNETDMPSLKIGQSASITPSGYPDMTITGKVVQIDLKATTQSNVSVFATTIEVPNKDGKLLWGMNADAEISVLSLKNVLTLPVSAIKTSTSGASTVTIMDGGQAISWDIQTGATDGSRTQILAGLDEGSEVVIVKRSSTTTTTTNSRGGTPNVGAIFGGFGRD